MGESNVTQQTLWEAVNGSKNELLSRLSHLDNKMAQIHSSMTALNDEIVEVQTRVSATQDNITDADKKITLQKKSWCVGIEGGLPGE